MAQLFVLFEGYSERLDDARINANCSCTLVRAKKNIIVDTMTAWDGQRIIAALAEHEIEPRDIDYVVCTHGHSDHIGNNNLFLNAEHIVGLDVHRGTVFYDKNLKNEPYRLCEGVRVVATPGHTGQDVSVLVDAVIGRDIFKIAVAGDLFENERDLEDPSIWQTLGNPELQNLQSRMRLRILEISDFIVPGHGPMFRVTDAMRITARAQAPPLPLPFEPIYQ